MRVSPRWTALCCLILLATLGACKKATPPSTVKTCPADRSVKTIAIIQENGGRVDWSPDGTRIVFDRQNADGYFDLYVMTPEGRIVASLTDGNSKINARHNGNSTWNPSGKYIVFLSEEEKHYNVGDKWPGNPGIGVYGNLWAMSPDGQQFWKLTDVPIKQTLGDGLPAMGVVNPRFSRDGSHLVWTERFADGGRWGKWRIKLADFHDSAGRPELANERIVLQPNGKMGLYMTALGFSPDGSTLLLSGNLDGQDEFGMDQYLFDLGTQKLTNLQNSPDLWEEGASWSPDGSHIVYMTNHGSPMNFDDPNWYWQKRTGEFWMMDANGSNKRQLTCFNVPGAPEYIAQGAIVAASAYSPDGKRLAGIVGVDYGTKEKADFKLKIALIEFR